MENQKNNLAEEEVLLPNMLDKVYKEIRANEAERAIRAIDAELMKAGVPLEEDVDEEEEEIGASEAKADAGKMFSEEDKELIRLGKIYRKRKKLHRYLVAAAAIIGVLAFGITSMGGPKKAFEKFERNVLGREQSGIDTDDNTKFVETIDEEEVYQEIENKYGFSAVKPVYLPEGITLLETNMRDEIQGIHLIYGTIEEAKISCHIRPNYRESSWGKDIEDELLKEKYMTVSDVNICLKQYQVDEKTERWLVGFEHNNVSYSMLIMDLEEAEVEKIVENLIFS